MQRQKVLENFAFAYSALLSDFLDVLIKFLIGILAIRESLSSEQFNYVIKEMLKLGRME